MDAIDAAYDGLGEHRRASDGSVAGFDSARAVIGDLEAGAPQELGGVVDWYRQVVVP